MKTARFKIDLEATLFNLEQLLDFEAQNTLGEIAFAGRSNVGKSSLLNALGANQKLARVSSTPGKTASINFYRVSPIKDDSKEAAEAPEALSEFFLVDLPGYGYAQRSKAEREKWAKLIAEYLERSKQIRALAILLDCRHSPQQLDLDLIAYARTLQLDLLPILTKADKCKQNERVAIQKEWLNHLDQKPLLSSVGKKPMGLAEIWRAISGFIYV